MSLMVGACQNNPKPAQVLLALLRALMQLLETPSRLFPVCQTGSSLGLSQSIVNGIKQVADENQSTACDGKVKIEYEILDDATAAAGKWSRRR